MTPPVEVWSAEELEVRALVGVNGMKRKDFDGKLKNCELLELLQYNCRVDEPKRKDSEVRCWPVERLFRR